MKRIILSLALILIFSVASAENNIFAGTLDEVLTDSSLNASSDEKITNTESISQSDLLSNLIPGFINQIGSKLELKSMTINDGVSEIVFNTTPETMAEVSELIDWKQISRLEYDQSSLRFVFGDVSKSSEDIPVNKDDGIETVSSVDEQYIKCPDCIDGHCMECNGRGVADCNICFGMGVCTVCFGKRQSYVPGYGGVGTGSYVTCKGCNGSGRCSFCNGTGEKDCIFCDGGVCHTCKGDYLHYKKK